MNRNSNLAIEHIKIKRLATIILALSFALMLWLLATPVTAWKLIEKNFSLLQETHSTSHIPNLMIGIAELIAWMIVAWVATIIAFVGLRTITSNQYSWINSTMSWLIPRSLEGLIASLLGIGVLVGTPVSASAYSSPHLDWPIENQTQTVITEQTSSTPTIEQVDTIAESVTPGPEAAQLYTVKKGDTLWDIAAKHLDGEVTNQRIASSWPQWWHLNEDVIGENPDLIKPGQQLKIPLNSDL